MAHDVSDILSQRVDSAIAEYLEAIKNGAQPDIKSFIARHGEIADELKKFLVDHQALDEAAQRVAELASTDGVPRSTGRSALSFRPRLIGPQQFGHFELIEEIARGGMGVVYKARQKTPSRTVALKMILSGQFASQADVDRFYAEAHAAAALDHPQIVPVFEVGEHEGQHYFTMALVEGESLAQRLARGPLPAKEAAKIIREVALAVEYAHQHGVIHRDLKPANILLEADGRVRVTDFGLAKRQTEDSGLTRTGELLGTPSFMSPEQVSGDPTRVGPASDIYALGATLYALITGRPPFQAANTVDTLKQVVEQDPVPPRELDATIPRDLETIVLKCLDKDRSRRYESAVSLAQDLQRFVNDEPVRACPPSAVYRIKKFVRRNTVLVAAAVLIFSALLTGVGVATWGLVKAQQGQTLAVGAQHELKSANVQLASELARAESAEELAHKQASQLGRQLYEVTFPRAAAAFADDQFRVAEEQLNGCPPDQRGWEWHWLDRQVRARLPKLSFPGRQLAQFTPDGRYIVAVDATTEASVKFWNASSGEAERSMVDSPARITQNRLSADGSQLAIGLENGSVALWDVPSGQLRWSVTAHSQRSDGLDFNFDGSRLASVSWDGTLKVLDTKDGREVASGRVEELSRHLQELRGAYFHPDGTRILTAKRQPLIDSASARIWDADTGGLIQDLEGTWPRSAKYSPDGKLIATGSSEGVVRIFDATTLQEVRAVPGHEGFISAIAFSQDGKRLASSGKDTTIRICDVQTGINFAILRGHAATVNYVDFSPDGRYLASSDARSVVNVWDTMAPEGLTTIDVRSVVAKDCSISSVAFSPSGDELLAATQFGEVKIYDTASLGEKRILAGADCRDATFSRDGKQIAAAVLGSIFVWNAVSGELVQQFIAHPGPVDFLAYSSDASRLATSAGVDGAIRVWDTTTWRPIQVLRGHNVYKGTIQAAFSPDGGQIASVANDGLKIWEVDRGSLLHNLTVGGNLNCVTYSPDGSRVVAGGSDGLLHIWDAHSGQELPSFSGGQNHGFSCIAFTPDGSRIVSGDFSGTLVVWSAQTGIQLLAQNAARGSTINDIAISPDGNSIAAANSDGTVRLWQIVSSENDSALRKDAERASRAADESLREHHCSADSISAICADASLPASIKQLGAHLAELRLSAEQELAQQNLRYLRELAESPDANVQVLDRCVWTLVDVEPARWGDPEAASQLMQNAVGVAKRAVELAPEDGRIWSTLGAAQFRAGDYHAAIETLAKSSKLEGDDLPNCFCLAMAEWKLGNQTAAREWYGKAIETLNSNKGQLANHISFMAEAKELLEIAEPQQTIELEPKRDRSESADKSTLKVPPTPHN